MVFCYLKCSSTSILPRYLKVYLTISMKKRRLSHFLGNNDLAIFHFMKLVTCSHQSPANQSNFLREFLYVVEVKSQDDY